MYSDDEETTMVFQPQPTLVDQLCMLSDALNGSIDADMNVELLKAAQNINKALEAATNQIVTAHHIGDIHEFPKSVN